jgi:hypothetical protein
MNSEFNKWWDEDDLTTQGNNFVDGTPAYCAWQGWCAGVKAERQRIIKVIESMGTWAHINEVIDEVRKNT